MRSLVTLIILVLPMLAGCTDEREPDFDGTGPIFVGDGGPEVHRRLPSMGGPDEPWYRFDTYNGTLGIDCQTTLAAAQQRPYISFCMGRNMTTETKDSSSTYHYANRTDIRGVVLEIQFHQDADIKLVMVADDRIISETVADSEAHRVVWKADAAWGDRILRLRIEEHITAAGVYHVEDLDVDFTHTILQGDIPFDMDSFCVVCAA